MVIGTVIMAIPTGSNLSNYVSSWTSSKLKAYPNENMQGNVAVMSFFVNNKNLQQALQVDENILELNSTLWATTLISSKLRSIQSMTKLSPLEIQLRKRYYLLASKVQQNICFTNQNHVFQNIHLLLFEFLCNPFLKIK